MPLSDAALRRKAAFISSRCGASFSVCESWYHPVAGSHAPMLNGPRVKGPSLTRLGCPWSAKAVITNCSFFQNERLPGSCAVSAHFHFSLLRNSLASFVYERVSEMCLARFAHACLRVYMFLSVCSHVRTWFSTSKFLLEWRPSRNKKQVKNL